jgi:hypothetical protein
MSGFFMHVGVFLACWGFSYGTEVFLHYCASGILAGESGAAVAAGINLMLWEEVTIGICQLQALSPAGRYEKLSVECLAGPLRRLDHETRNLRSDSQFTLAVCACDCCRCQSFESTGDGYGRGEAVAMLLLQAHEPKEGADTGGSGMGAVIGSAVNQDGRSSSLTAPNGPSQEARIHFTALHFTGAEWRPASWVLLSSKTFHASAPPVGSALSQDDRLGSLFGCQAMPVLPWKISSLIFVVSPRAPRN